MNLTKDADKMIRIIYRDYLGRRKQHLPRSLACRFDEDYFSSSHSFDGWLKADLDFTLLELARAGLIRLYIGGSFDLDDPGVIYMENRFKNGLMEVAEFVSKFIP